MRALWFLAPVVLAAVAHHSALDSGFTNWDDPVYLLRNPMTEDPFGQGAIALLTTRNLLYPIPVTVLGYAAQRQVFALDPVGYHVVSILLHAGVVALLFGLARRLGASRPSAGIAASLFAVHPLGVEPVAWVTGQKDLWCALFLLAALLVRAGGSGRGRLAAALALAALAMLSKPTAVCAPVLLAALDYALRRPLRPQLRVYGALMALAAVVIGLSMWGHESAGMGPSSHIGLGSLLRSAWTVKVQLVHVIVPYPLAARYYVPGGAELILGVVAGVAATAALVAVLVRCVRRDQRMAAAGILAALAAYAPTSGIVPLSRGAADSYMYLPLALAAAFAAMAAGRLTSLAPRRTIASAAAIAALFCGLSWSAHRHWRHAPSLWRQVIEVNPGEPHALYRAGNGFLWVKRPDLALAMFERIEAEYPDFVTSRGVHAETLLALGRVVEADRRFAAAAEHGALLALDRYGFFLIKHDVTPADPEAARTAMLMITPLLATRGKRPSSLRRAIERLRATGDHAAAALVERRLQEISAR